MKNSGKLSLQQGFTLIEVIISLVTSAIIGVIFLAFMSTQLMHSGDPVIVAREEGAAEAAMEQILSDYVKEMNKTGGYETALATIYSRDYKATPYSIPTRVSVTKTYIAYDNSGNEVAASGGSSSDCLKLTVKANGHGLTSILSASRATDGDPPIFF